jgi:hypothetical protein
MDTVVRTSGVGANDRVHLARSRQPTHSRSRRVRWRMANPPHLPSRPSRHARAGCSAPTIG